MANSNSVPAQTTNANAADSTRHAPLQDVGSKVPADYTRNVNVTRQTSEHVHGKQTTVHSETKTDDVTNGVFDNRVMELFNGAIQEREARENKRANHRNFNRLMTLFGAVVIGLIVTYMSVHGVIPAWLAPYTFVITVLLDSTFSLYALIRHY